MSNNVLIKRSNVQGKAPTTASLQLGELALNTYDGNLFFKKSPNGVDSLVSVATNGNLLSYLKITSNTTAASRQSYIADTSGGTFTLTLPASPNSGDWITVVDGSNFLTHPLNIGRNSSTIAGFAQDLTLNISGVSVTLVYDGNNWDVYTQVGASGGTASGGGGSPSNAVLTSGSYSDPSWIVSLSYSKLTGTPSLSTVATTGSYNDLTNKPTIPTVPSLVSAFTNDAGYLTSVDAGSLTGTTLKSTVVNSSLTSVGTLTSLSSSGLVTLSYTGAGSTSTLAINGYNSKGGTGYHDFLKVTNGYSSASNPTKSFRLDSSGNLQVLNSAYTAVILQVSDAGQLSVAGATSTNNDATSNWLSFNNNQTSIYDDGNTHIHNRASGQSIWINTNGGDLRLLQQSTVNGGAVGNSVMVGGSQSSTATAFLNVLGSKSYSITGYGYLSSGGAGSISGSSGTVAYGIYNANRMQSAEIDVTSDERAKNIQGTIPLESAIKFVKDVDGILYTWKEDKTEAEYDAGLKAGFGAQAVHKAGFDHMIGHIPNPKMEKLVDDDGWVHPEGVQLTMGYNQVIPYHHEVIKHLLERIEKLEEQLKANNV